MAIGAMIVFGTIFVLILWEMLTSSSAVLRVLGWLAVLFLALTGLIFLDAYHNTEAYQQKSKEEQDDGTDV